MQFKKRVLLELYTTPKQLRDIAEKLEAMWKTSKAGDNVPRLTVDAGLEGEVIYVIDQEAMYDER